MINNQIVTWTAFTILAMFFHRPGHIFGKILGVAASTARQTPTWSSSLGCQSENIVNSVSEHSLSAHLSLSLLPRLFDVDDWNSDRFSRLPKLMAMTTVTFIMLFLIINVTFWLSLSLILAHSSVRSSLHTLSDLFRQKFTVWPENLTLSKKDPQKTKKWTTFRICWLWMVLEAKPMNQVDF